MVIEGIITTENSDGTMHVAPIGPHVDPHLTDWTLKPFQSSTTFENLRSTSRGVFHIVDDSLLMAAAVLGLCNEPESEYRSELCDATHLTNVGWILNRSCRAVGLAVNAWDFTAPRATASCIATHRETRSEFWGWNRARHSILELAILASRVHILDKKIVVEELERHRIIVEKTAGPREFAAWELLKKHLSP